MTKPILPGSIIGVLGSGQLGRMFAISARQLGYRVHTLSPDSDTPTGQVADKEWKSSYDDLDQVRKFAKEVSVVTFEFENIPVKTVEAAAELVPVHPKGSVLHTAQHRLREKTFLSKSGFPVVPFAEIRSEADVAAAVKKIGTPAVLKTAGFGYDGKGQKKISSVEEAITAYKSLGVAEMVLEGFIDFQCEVSVIGVRSADGSFTHFGILENAHKNHILDLTLSPARVSASVARDAIEIAQGIMEKLDVVGVMCVEMFLTKSNSILVNELAPRPHNSGHFTIDACVTSQFEQQLRAVCGLPLGSTEQWQPAAMVNLLGDCWNGSEPRWDKALDDPSIKLHLYGKAEARPGRKMGHITAVAPTIEQARDMALRARDAL